MGGFLSVIGTVFLFAVIAFGMWGCPTYNVWQQGLAGQAELARADMNRKIKIREAEAHMESSTLYAKSEIERAKGVAEANKIIGDSLHGNEVYLRYLWVQGLREGKDHTVIYVPTEANLPMLEAGKRP